MAVAETQHPKKPVQPELKMSEGNMSKGARETVECIDHLYSLSNLILPKFIKHLYKFTISILFLYKFIV